MCNVFSISFSSAPSMIKKCQTILSQINADLLSFFETNIRLKINAYFLFVSKNYCVVSFVSCVSNMFFRNTQLLSLHQITNQIGTFAMLLVNILNEFFDLQTILRIIVIMAIDLALYCLKN
jgi:hypothetical protein